MAPAVTTQKLDKAREPADPPADEPADAELSYSEFLRQLRADMKDFRAGLVPTGCEECIPPQRTAPGC